MKKLHIYRNSDFCKEELPLCGRKNAKRGVSLMYTLQYDNSVGIDMQGWCCKCLAKARLLKNQTVKQFFNEKHKTD